MLLTLGADPSNCGYRQEQIDQCLKNLTVKGIHQEREGIEHLGYLLRMKGLMDKPFIGAIKARERPRVMKLRFDPEKSPIDGIPVDLREPLYRILMEHVEGAIRRSDRTWIDFDPLTDPGLRRPYSFEPHRAASTRSRAST